MKTYNAALQNALAQGVVVPRDFIWITARDRATGDPRPYGFWSGGESVSAPIEDIVTGAVGARIFDGAGGLVSMGPVSMVAGLQVQTATLNLSQIDAAAQQVVRGYDAQRAPVEVYRGYLDPVSNLLVAPAQGRFYGFVDDAQIETPEENGEGLIQMVLAGFEQELTRSNSARRSDPDQRLRDPNDSFFQHVTTVPNWKIVFGQPG
jgi:hypothetical protein